MSDPSPKAVTVVPLLGPLHVRLPQYNAVSVLRSVQAFRPSVVALAPLTQGQLQNPAWQECAELPLPHTVVPWARRTGIPLAEIGATPEDESAEADFRRYLETFEGGKALLASVDAEERPIRQLLDRPLTLDSILEELVPAVERFQERRRDAFGEGPGTGFQEQRAALMAEAVLDLEGERVAVLASADDVPSLLAALDGRAELSRPPSPPVDEAVRRRSLLDYAMRGEAPDPEALLDQLQEIDEPEARYLEANVLLQSGEPDAALQVLEQASTQDFVDPYYLPGFLLTRLGQLYDLAGRRDAALRAYRGARALSFAPAEALVAAEAGLEQPFTLTGTEVVSGR
ncbi:MAG: hypothetical protein P8Y13_04410 [Deinococcales bacterium]